MNNLKIYLKNFRRANGTRLTDAAIRTRLTAARAAVRHLGMPIEEAVRNDETMFRALTTLVAHPEACAAKESNALRHAWMMTHGTKFPRLRNYKVAA